MYNLMSRYVKQLCFFFICLKLLLMIHPCGWKQSYVSVSLITKARVPTETIIKLRLILSHLLRMHMPYVSSKMEKVGTIRHLSCTYCTLNLILNL